MKLLFTTIIALLTIAASAGEYVRYQNQWTTVYTNVTFSSNVTANVVFTNTQDTARSVYHTFHLIYAPAGTNTSTIILDRTIDGANYVPFQTNTLTGSTNSYEYNVAGKWLNYRYRATVWATNVTITGNYMSQ